MKKSGKRITDITIKDVKNYLIDERYKIKKEVESFTDLPKMMFSTMSPVFFVSTGRAGSELLVRLMNESKVGMEFMVEQIMFLKRVIMFVFFLKKITLMKQFY